MATRRYWLLPIGLNNVLFDNLLFRWFVFLVRNNAKQHEVISMTQRILRFRHDPIRTTGFFYFFVMLSETDCTVESTSIHWLVLKRSFIVCRKFLYKDISLWRRAAAATIAAATVLVKWITKIGTFNYISTQCYFHALPSCVNRVHINLIVTKIT